MVLINYITKLVEKFRNSYICAHHRFLVLMSKALAAKMGKCRLQKNCNNLAELDSQ